MKSNVFRVTRGISDKRLFVRCPRNHAQAEGEAIAIDRLTHGGTIHPVGVGKTNGMDVIKVIKGEAKEQSSFKIVNDADHSIPVFRLITIEDRHQMSESKSNVQMDGNHQIIK